ncbi:MAG: hypothetical protein Q7T05_03800 [Dehalococcoidia bacterium]|nr:hypothetical protein [Dehalococcoidia bacterium]
MRRGCMSVGDISCDSCGRVIKHPEQYLGMDEDDIQVGDDILKRLQKERPERIAGLKGRHGPLRLCGDCATKRGYASYQSGKSEKSLTFFEKRAEL